MFSLNAQLPKFIAVGFLEGGYFIVTAKSMLCIVCCIFQIIPLFKHKEVTGEKLVEDLRHEAEEQRKEKKRNTVSGIHK